MLSLMEVLASHQVARRPRIAKAGQQRGRGKNQKGKANVLEGEDEASQQKWPGSEEPEKEQRLARQVPQQESMFHHIVGRQEQRQATSNAVPGPYQVSDASRAIVLGELLSKRLEELDTLRLSLGHASEEASREDVLNKIAALELEIHGLKGEQKT